MTDEDLAHLEKLCAEASDAGWSFEETDDLTGVGDIYDGNGNAIIKTDCGAYPPEMPDARFICEARSALPKLLAEVRRLKAAATEEREACARECDKIATAVRTSGESVITGARHRAPHQAAHECAAAIRSRKP